jgi:two-component system, cell cycle response regulator DivK
MNTDHFLYVEDEPSNQLVMKLLMEKALGTKNYTIFDHSANFMKRLKDLPIRPSIIMLDIHIAPLNGFELLHLIREDPLYLDTKIIALTASVMIEEVEKMRNSGFDGAIGKPIDLSTFPSVIRRILDGEMVWQI